MKTICPTCQSDRCGNHAACARRHAAFEQWRSAWLTAWEQIGACASIVLKVQQTMPERTAEEIMREFVRIEQGRQAREALRALFFRGRL